MLSLMIVTMTLSGCISSEETEGKEIVHSPPEEPEYFEKGDYNCIDYDDMDRCWQTHVPENLSSDLPVPLIVDIHGWGGTAGGQMFVSGLLYTYDAADEERVVYIGGVLAIH